MGNPGGSADNVESEWQKPYCLKCYATMVRDEVLCPDCGFANYPSIRRAYWNQDPNLICVEIQLKALIVFLCTVLSVIILFGTRHTGVGAGFTIALPIYLGTGMWMTASCLTSKSQYFKPTVFWSATFVMSGIVSGYIRYSMSGDALTAWIIFLILVLFGVLSIIVRFILSRWKRNRIRYGGSKL